jgi:dethiobiotin synthase
MASARARIIGITGTGTGVGKTHVTIALARHIASLGHSVRVLKPLATGGPEDADAYAAAGIAQAAGGIVLPDPIAPVPAAARAGVRLDDSEIAGLVSTAALDSDLTLLVEGLGGSASPATPSEAIGGLLSRCCDAVVLVASLRLGGVHEFAATLAWHRSMGHSLAGLVTFDGDRDGSLMQRQATRTEIGRIRPASSDCPWIAQVAASASHITISAGPDALPTTLSILSPLPASA